MTLLKINGMLAMLLVHVGMSLTKKLNSSKVLKVFEY